LKNVADKEDEFVFEVGNQQARRKSPDYMTRSSNEFAQKSTQNFLQGRSPFREKIRSRSVSSSPENNQQASKIVQK